MYISKLLKNNKILLCLIFFILLFISGCEVSQNPCVNHIDNNNDMYCDICNKILDCEHEWLNATCEKPMTCSKCNITKGEALGHDLVEYEGLEATCTKSGYNDYVICNKCDYTTFEVIPPSHKKGPIVIENEVNYSCTVNWTHDEVIYCLVCNQELSRINKIIKEASGHNFSTEWTIDKEPTYTEVGQKSKHCLNCDEITDIREIPIKTEENEYFTFELNSDEQSYTLTGVIDKNIEEAIIPSTYESLPVTSIGDWAFYNCSSLTSIEIPNSVTSIGNYAFEECSSLTSIYIPNSVTSIGGWVFNGCDSLTSIIVDENNPVYDSRDNSNVIIETSTNTLIAGCQSTIIPNSITSIGYSAFSGCSSLTSIEIPNSVTSIGLYAFSNCTSLTSIEIPNSVTSIGNYAFGGCNSLTSIVVDENNPVYDSRDNCNAIIETSTNKLILGCQNTIIPNSVTSIGSYAFYYCTSLTSIEIPNSVTSIGDSAFISCYSLTSIEIPNSVTSIGEDAFYGCSSLTSIEIPNSVTSIGSYAFYYCSSLTIYCEVESLPTCWSVYWNPDNRPVYWGTSKD